MAKNGIKMTRVICLTCNKKLTYTKGWEGRLIDKKEGRKFCRKKIKFDAEPNTICG